MTVITKAISEKKAADKMEQPLVVEKNMVDVRKNDDPEAPREKSDLGRRYIVSRRSVQRIHVTATFLLFLVALMILIIGVIGGLCIYRQYARMQMHRFCTGWYNIPYDSSNRAPYGRDVAIDQSLLSDSDLITYIAATKQEEVDKLQRTMDNDIRSFFKERFEIDLENGLYEKIDVPDFRGGRRGRFIHDFNINKTGIIDIDGQSCFVMPLNRQRVLPPRNMYDLLTKMYNGYYEVDTEIVRETMKVVTPPITDLSTIGTYIAHECQDLPTYILKKVNPVKSAMGAGEGSDASVVKRSVSNGVFGQFAGRNIIEFDILNLTEILQEAKGHTKNVER